MPVHSFSRSVHHQYAFTAPPSSSSAPEAVHTPLSRPVLQDAIRAFQRRLFDYTSFTCPICGDIHEAPVLVGDGTEIAPPRNLSCDPAPRVCDDQKKSGSQHHHRVLIPDPLTRELIYRFCGQPLVKNGATPIFTHTVRMKL